MRKLPTLAVILLSAIIVLVASCGKDTTGQPSVIHASYGGAAHTFGSERGMFIYQASGYSALIATETATHDTLYMAIQGTDTGTYTIGPSQNSTLSLKTGTRTYASANAHSHGYIHISQFDSRTMFATGDFSGVLTGSSAGDTITVAQGTVYVSYQF